MADGIECQIPLRKIMKRRNGGPLRSYPNLISEGIKTEKARASDLLYRFPTHWRLLRFPGFLTFSSRSLEQDFPYCGLPLVEPSGGLFIQLRRRIMLDGAKFWSFPDSEIVTVFLVVQR